MFRELEKNAEIQGILINMWFPGWGGFGPAPQEVAVTDIPGQYRIYTGGVAIHSFTSIAPPWDIWTQEAGECLHLDPAFGHESKELIFPTVVKRVIHDYLVIYETRIPGCIGDPSIC